MNYFNKTYINYFKQKYITITYPLSWFVKTLLISIIIDIVIYDNIVIFNLHLTNFKYYKIQLSYYNNKPWNLRNFYLYFINNRVE